MSFSACAWGTCWQSLGNLLFRAGVQRLRDPPAEIVNDSDQKVFWDATQGG
jgi:hypothetical protein